MPRLIPLSALAREFGWSVSKLHRLVDARRIPHLRIGARRDVYFERDAIEAWIAAQRVAEHNAKAAAAAPPARSKKTIEEECRALGVAPDPAFV
jgi:predicted DNA-binding transcriptional regulator AlpA